MWARQVILSRLPAPHPTPHNLIDGVGGGGVGLHLYHSRVAPTILIFPSVQEQSGHMPPAHSTTAILVGREVEKKFHYFRPCFLWILACQSRRESNGHTEIPSLHALSSSLFSGVAKKARLARHCVNDTVKRPKWSATPQCSLLLSALLSRAHLGYQGNRLENMPVVWKRRSQHLALTDKNLDPLRIWFCQTPMSIQSTPIL